MSELAFSCVYFLAEICKSNQLISIKGAQKRKINGKRKQQVKEEWRGCVTWRYKPLSYKITMKINWIYIKTKEEVQLML